MIHHNFTPEQVKAVQNEAKRAADREAAKVLRRYVRGAVAGFLILLSGLVIQNRVESADREDRRQEAAEARQAIADSGNAIAVTGCNRDFTATRKLRALIRGQRGQIEQYRIEGTLTDAQARRAQEQISQNIRETPLPDCREVQNAVTDDPDQRITVPEPLFKGSPAAKALRLAEQKK